MYSEWSLDGAMTYLLRHCTLIYQFNRFNYIYNHSYGTFMKLILEDVGRVFFCIELHYTERCYVLYIPMLWT